MKKNLRENLYLLFIVSIVIPVFLISAIFFETHNREVRTQENQHVHNVLAMASTEIYSYLNEMEKISSAPYLYSDIYSMVLRMKNGTVGSASQAEVNQFDLTYLKLIYNCPDTVENIAFYPSADKDDTVYLLSRSVGEIQKLSTAGYFAEDWFSGAQEADGKILLSGIHSTTYPGQRKSSGIITLSRAIKDFDTQKSIGVLRVDVSAEGLTALLDKIGTTAHSGTVLLNQNDVSIYRTGSIVDSVLQKLKTWPASIGGGLNSYSVSKTEIPVYGWKLAYLSSQADLFSSSFHSLLFSVAVMLFTVLLAFSVYSRQSRQILTSVGKIVGTIRRLGTGDLSAKAGVQSQDELSLISNAIDQLGARLNEHIEREYKAAISQKNAEYMALQSQINPHFFYNTLNGFLSLNRMGEQELLEKSIIELTQLFRYTCSGEKFSSVEEEFTFLRKYLELQKLRFEERLNYTVELDEEAGREKIPRLLLQPLVENSIVHGMEPRQQPIHICVEGRILSVGESAGSLELSVSDDGAGFDPQKAHGDPSKVGLGNVEERLRFFRSASRLSVESSPGRGTVCTLVIPCEGSSPPARLRKPENGGGI